MVLSLMSIAKTYALAVALGVTAAALFALVALCVAYFHKLNKKQAHLTKTEVYAHVLRPKREVVQESEQKDESRKSRKKQNEQAAQQEKKPKRGKKTKKQKYVFASDVKSDVKEDNVARDEEAPESKDGSEEDKTE